MRDQFEVVPAATRGEGGVLSVMALRVRALEHGAAPEGEGVKTRRNIGVIEKQVKNNMARFGSVLLLWG